MSSHEKNKSVVGAEHHIQPVWQYHAVFAALIVFMGLTIAAAQVSLPGGTAVNNIVAMGIALIKGTLVVSIFMGVMHGTKLVKFWAISGLLSILLFLFIGIDYWSRGSEAVKGFYNDEGSGLHTGHIQGDPSTMKPVTPEEYEKAEEEIKKNSGPDTGVQAPAP